ncbi:hypothetical protein D3C79_1067570 [compost metagenome]
MEIIEAQREVRLGEQAIEEGADLQPEGLDGAQQDGIAAGAIEGQVELTVVVQITLDVALLYGGVHALHATAQLVQIGCG